MGPLSHCIVDGLGHYLSGDVSEVLGIMVLTQKGRMVTSMRWLSQLIWGACITGWIADECSAA